MEKLFCRHCLVRVDVRDSFRDTCPDCGLGDDGTVWCLTQSELAEVTEAEQSPGKGGLVAHLLGLENN